MPRGWPARTGSCGRSSTGSSSSGTGKYTPCPPAPSRGLIWRECSGTADGPTSTALARFEADLVNHQTTARAIHERLYFRPLLEAFTTRHRVPMDASAIGRDVYVAEGGESHVGRTRRAGPVGMAGPVATGMAGSAGSASPAPTGGSDGADGAVAAGAPPALLSETAIGERLTAFGFSDARRTRDAVLELTQGFSRTSRLMQAMVPLVLDWLSESPDPDLGLLGLRRLATGAHRRARLNALFRESPEAARHLCLLLGTSPLFAGGYERHPEQLGLLETGPPALPGKEELERRALETIAWRHRSEWWRGLASLQRSEVLRAQARDVLGLEDVAATGRSLSCLAEAVLEVALWAVGGARGIGANGTDDRTARKGDGGAAAEHGQAGAGADERGWRRSARPRGGVGIDGYGPVRRVRAGIRQRPRRPGRVRRCAIIPAEEAEEMAEALLRLVSGETPVQRLYELDLALRPEGRKGSLARSLKAYEGYYERWAQVWERQALTRGRFVAGDPNVGRRFGVMARHFLWGSPLSDDDVFEIRRMKARIERERVPPGEDPEFHLKLGPGSLSDVEWTVQLLQLRHGISAEGTLDALDALTAAGVMQAADTRALAESYRFCEATRNRLYLVRGRPGDALPAPGHHLTSLARSLGTTAPALREQYRRLTRRARRVTERLFYGSE